MSDSLTNARGMALVAVLLFGAVLSTIALGLSLLVSEEHLVVRSMREGLGLQYAARAGLEAAARALDAADWDAVLRGDEQAPGVDGAPDGRRMVDGAYAIDLAEETALQNCGRATGCTDAELRAISVERPWGANNPTWRLFYFRPLRELGPYAHAPAAYLLVWAGDDGREVDGDPERDDQIDEATGRHIVRLRAVAVGRDGARRGVEAEASKICRAAMGAPVCQPGIRVQSWRDLRASLP